MLLMDDATYSPQPTNKDCALYVHTPFCETKCGYCDFFSVALKDRPTEPIVSSTICELTTRVPAVREHIRTVFVGGGTPTLLPLPQLQRLLGAINACVRTADLDEYCVEANPATVDDAKAALLASAGVTRVSLGAQSFLQQELTALERIHRPEDVAPSVAILRRHGIRQINLDLIFGIPGQTKQSWRYSLKEAIAIGVDHLACYGLTYEPGTKLTAQRRRGLVTVCEEDLEAELYETTIDTLAGAGYGQYEISNFAKPGCRSQHNLMYWRNRDYVGVGPSAVGMIDGTRYRNVPDIHRYVAMMNEHGAAVIETEQITPEKVVLEIIMMQLRLNEGIDVAEFHRRTGLDPFKLFEDRLDQLQARGLVRTDDTHIALTRAGSLLANSIMTELAVAADLHEPATPCRQ